VNTPILLEGRHVALSNATLAAVVHVLESRRKVRGMSCDAMCARTGITPRWWRQLRAGAVRAPLNFSVRVLIALCAVVELPLSELSATVDAYLREHPPTLPPDSNNTKQPSLPHTTRPTP
jgi:hypothetical protein